MDHGKKPFFEPIKSHGERFCSLEISSVDSFTFFLKNRFVPNCLTFDIWQMCQLPHTRIIGTVTTNS